MSLDQLQYAHEITMPILPVTSIVDSQGTPSRDGYLLQTCNWKGMGIIRLKCQNRKTDNALTKFKWPSAKHYILSVAYVMISIWSKLTLTHFNHSCQPSGAIGAAVGWLFLGKQMLLEVSGWLIIQVGWPYKCEICESFTACCFLGGLTEESR